MNVDGVFAGGGVKAFAFIGALQVMEESGYTFSRLAGTSAGAIFASLIRAGYTSEELLTMLDDLDIKKFKDAGMSIVLFPFAKWLRLYYRLGMYSGVKLEQWLSQALKEKGISTFADLPVDSLKIIASDISRGRLIVLPDDLPDYGINPQSFSIAHAVRMSCSVPYFFEPVKLYNRKKGGERSYVVDGGILSNFPLWVFSGERDGTLRRPVLGFQLKPELDEIPPNEIKNAIDLYQSLFVTMRQAHDLRYISKKHAKNIVFIPVDNVTSTDFNLDQEQKKVLIELGRQETARFLHSWSY
ncbi:patatin-like phospholipase family protein [Halalkalibacterium ligniniphilum]|uniref:patatin-like phospholipase family protein n=1 Tax=Halalkalibacterium ligniniphilum TaxID=1134413 RepID=UPI00034AF3C2|nr:patatin-like phospholipase family protein [Halalkalibacterium ligniniphilum]